MVLLPCHCHRYVMQVWTHHTPWQISANHNANFVSAALSLKALTWKRFSILPTNVDLKRKNAPELVLGVWPPVGSIPCRIVDEVG
jgi:hypothetical protein